MNWYRTRNGEPALWLTEVENEIIMEDELRKAGLFPSTANPVVDIERFLERHLGAQVDQYASLPSDVLGMTEFVADYPPRISINRDLTGAMEGDYDGDEGQLGRWRATLAHEAGHVVLHRCIFEPDSRQGDLFGTSRSENGSRLMRCLKRNVAFRRGGGEWPEIQANRGMAALLMPAALFKEVATEEGKQFGRPLDDAGISQVLSRRLAKRFRVSRQAAAIRLGTLRLVGDSDQMDMAIA